MAGKICEAGDVHDVTQRDPQIDNNSCEDRYYRQRQLITLGGIITGANDENREQEPLTKTKHACRKSFYAQRQGNHRSARETPKNREDKVFAPCGTRAGLEGNSRVSSGPQRGCATDTGISKQVEGGQEDCTKRGAVLKSNRSESKYDIFSARNRPSEGYRTSDLMDLIKLPQSACSFRSVTSTRKNKSGTCNIAVNSLLPPSDAKEPNGLYMESIRRIYDVTEAKRRKEEQYRNLVKRQMYMGFHSYAECESYMKYLDRTRNVSSAGNSSASRRQRHRSASFRTICV